MCIKLIKCEFESSEFSYFYNNGIKYISGLKSESLLNDRFAVNELFKNPLFQFINHNL